MSDRYKVIASIYVIMLREGQVLLLRRLNTGYCDGQYALPAGHVEAGESIVQAMIREGREEIGVEFLPKQLKVVHLRSRNAADWHRVDHFFVATQWSGKPRNTEPEKCDDLSWFPLDALPVNTIPYIRDVLERVQRGEVYSEDGWSKK